MSEELRQELSGIFNWSRDGLQSLRARGVFNQPQSSGEAIQELEDSREPSGRIGAGPLHAWAGQKGRNRFASRGVYRQWCSDNGRGAASRQIFGRDLRASRHEVKVGRPWADGQPRQRQYVGLTIRNITDCADCKDDEEQYRQLSTLLRRK